MSRHILTFACSPPLKVPISLMDRQYDPIPMGSKNLSLTKGTVYHKRGRENCTHWAPGGQAATGNVRYYNNPSSRLSLPLLHQMLELAASMIRQVMPEFSGRKNVIILCDSWYVKKNLVSIIDGFRLSYGRRSFPVGHCPSSFLFLTWTAAGCCLTAAQAAISK